MGAGVHALQHPDVMLSYGAKDSLVKLRNMATGMPDTCCYYHPSEFLEAFPALLAQVLKAGMLSALQALTELNLKCRKSVAH